jgi:hypothetical protein
VHKIALAMWHLLLTGIGETNFSIIMKKIGLLMAGFLFCGATAVMAQQTDTEQKDKSSNQYSTEQTTPSDTTQVQPQESQTSPAEETLTPPAGKPADATTPVPADTTATTPADKRGIGSAGSTDAGSDK